MGGAPATLDPRRKRHSLPAAADPDRTTAARPVYQPPHAIKELLPLPTPPAACPPRPSPRAALSASSPLLSHIRRYHRCRQSTQASESSAGHHPTPSRDHPAESSARLLRSPPSPSGRAPRLRPASGATVPNGASVATMVSPPILLSRMGARRLTPPQRNYIAKIVSLGDSGCGKSSVRYNNLPVHLSARAAS